MDKFLQIVQLVGTCLSILVVVIIPMILYLWKKVKELIAAPSDKKPTVLLDIYNNVVQYIQDAEKMFNGRYQQEIVGIVSNQERLYFRKYRI